MLGDTTVGYKYSQDCSLCLNPATSKFLPLAGPSGEQGEPARTKGRGWGGASRTMPAICYYLSRLLLCVWAPCYAFAYAVCLSIAIHPTEALAQHSTWVSLRPVLSHLSPARPPPHTPHKYTLQSVDWPPAGHKTPLKNATCGQKRPSRLNGSVWDYCFSKYSHSHTTFSIKHSPIGASLSG